MGGSYNHLNLHGLCEAEDVFLVSVQPDYNNVPLLHNLLSLLSDRGYNKWPSAYVILGSEEVKIIQKNLIPFLSFQRTG